MTKELPKQPQKKPKITYIARTKPMPPSVAATLRELASYVDEQSQDEARLDAEQQAKPEEAQEQP